MPVQFEKWFRVDLNKKAMTEWIGNGLFTNDNLSNLIGVELYDGLTSIDIPGNVEGILILPNGGTLTINGSHEGNRAWIELPETALSLEGLIVITIKTTINDRKVTLVQCSGRVVATETGMVIDPDDIVPKDVTEFMAMLDDLRDLIDGYSDIIMVQDTQPGSETNKLWLLKTPVDGIQIPTMDDLNSVSSAVSGLVEDVTDIQSDLLDVHSDLDDAIERVETLETTTEGLSDSVEGLNDSIEELSDGIEALSDSVDDMQDTLEHKADIDGYYTDMTVGAAEQVVSSTMVEDNAPYTLRTSGGSTDIGNRAYVDKIVGGTVAWNQQVRDAASENVTEYADVVTVTDAVEDDAAVSVMVEPVQDLHGYDSPWPAGGGKNLLENTGTTQVINGVTFTVNADGTITINGTATGSITFPINNNVSIGAGNYVISGISGGSTSTYKMEARIDGVWGNNIFDQPVTKAVTSEITNVVLVVYSGATLSNVKISPMICLASAPNPTVFAPYSNLCPISGWDEVKVYVSPTTEAEDGRTYTIQLPTEAGTVYGGELTVNKDGSGVLTQRMYYFKPQSMDDIVLYTDDTTHQLYRTANRTSISTSIYGGSGALSNFTTNFGNAPSHGTTPVVQFPYSATQIYLYFRIPATMNPLDCEFVYEMAEPQTYTLTATQVTTLLGTNHVWSDAGQLSLTYTGTDEHLTLTSGRKYLSRINGTDSMVLGAGQSLTAVKGRDNVHDLTQMFGTAVADYVYQQGASYFRRWFGGTRYAYNAGELISVQGVQSRDVVGFNQWDEEWELGLIAVATGMNVVGNGIRSKGMCMCIPNTAYYANIPYTYSKYIFWYDASEEFISVTSVPNSGNVTSPSNACYFRIRVDTIITYNHDICINLSHNASRNGEYEPYTHRSYPLDSTLTLRGIPKVDSNGVYWDGDEYGYDGAVKRRYGVVDLGTLTWSYVPGDYSRMTATLTGAKIAASGAVANIICQKYTADTVSHIYAHVADKTIGVHTTLEEVWVHDSGYTDPATFKAAMSGVYLIYELAAPTDETAAPYQQIQQVDDWGTEEFVSISIVPVGHATRYPANLRDKLQHLPALASANGSYIITQTDGQMVLSPFPAPPTAAGNYLLKATVSGGNATYSWVAQ